MILMKDNSIWHIRLNIYFHSIIVISFKNRLPASELPTSPSNLAHEVRIASSGAAIFE